MPNSAAQPAKSKTLSKREVIDLLGRSKRTVETYIAQGALAVQYVKGPNGKQAIFSRDDVERFKREMDEPVSRAVVGVNGVPNHLRDLVDKRAAVAKALIPAPDVSSLALALRSILRVDEPRIKPWLTLAEAAEYSGLPSTYLLAQARAGAIRAVNVGTGTKWFWRFHRSSLAK